MGRSGARPPSAETRCQSRALERQFLTSAAQPSQLVLQAMGRRDEEDFNNFHDFEHWPGVMLTLIRLVLWGLFVYGMTTNMLTTNASGDLGRFLKRLAARACCFPVPFEPASAQWRVGLHAVESGEWLFSPRAGAPPPGRGGVPLK